MPCVARVVTGDGDADGAVRIGGHHRRALQSEGPATENGEQLCTSPVEDGEAGGGRDEHVVVAAAAQVGSGDPPDDLAADRLRPPRHRGAVRAVERPHQPARAGVGTLDHLDVAVTLEVADGRAVGRRPAEVGLPDDAAPGVQGEDRVGVGCARVIGAGADRDPGLATGEEVPDRRRRVHRLVGVMVTDQVAAGTEHPDMSAVAVGLTVRDPRGRVPTLDHVGLAVPVQVGERRASRSCCRR